MILERIGEPLHDVWSYRAAAEPIQFNAMHRTVDLIPHCCCLPWFIIQGIRLQRRLAPQIASMAESTETPLSRGNALLASGDYEAALAAFHEVGLTVV